MILMDSNKFILKLLMRIILLLVITAILILISISCKKDAEINTNSDTTFLNTNDSVLNLYNKLDFLIVIFIYNVATDSLEMTDANLVIMVGKNDSIVKALTSSTNRVTIRDDASEYTIKVTKQDYVSYSAIFTSNELKTKFDLPLIIVLKPVSKPLIFPKLLAYYPFNSNARDMSGNGYNGIVYGGASYGKDRLGNSSSAYVFNGNGNYIFLGNNFDIPEKTINIWFNCSSFLTGNKNDINYLFSNDNHNLSYSDDYLYIRRVSGVERLYFAVNVATGDIDNLDSVNFNYNTWYNPCITVEKDSIRYYLNGVLLNSHVNTVNYHSNEGVANVVLGSNRIGQDNYFKGSIDDIRIYNFALKGQQIDSLYRNLKLSLKK